MNDKKEWYKEIPENGVLCKDCFNGYVLVIPVNEDNERVLCDNEDCVTTMGAGYHHDDLTPITAQEWWEFAPWRNIRTVPSNENVFVIANGVFQYCPCQFDGKYWLDIYGDIIEDFFPTKWLPLPKVES